jgi:hypothetical protein
MFRLMLTTDSLPGMQGFGRLEKSTSYPGYQTRLPGFQLKNVSNFGTTI